jgi:hypothetical protein
MTSINPSMMSWLLGRSPTSFTQYARLGRPPTSFTQFARRTLTVR